MRSFRTIKGPDATIVKVPPKIAANPIGIINFEGLIPVLFEILLMAGKNKAAAPMFCINDETNPTVVVMKTRILFSLCPAILMIPLDMDFMTPDLSIPYPIIITAITDMTALLAKPENASFTVIIPAHGKSSIIRTATKSVLSFSVINNTIAITKIP
jgi:hypothetical protein